MLQNSESFGVLPYYGVGGDVEGIDSDVVLDSQVTEVTGCECVQLRFCYDITSARSCPAHPAGGRHHYRKDFS